MANPSLSRAATLALALVLAGGTARAGSGRVSGQVTGPDGRPIGGVEVASGTARATTDAGGLYALEGVETGGRVVVSFAKAGFATTHGAVEIPSAADADADGVPDAQDRCPVSDQRPNVTIDGCDTGLGNGIRKGCTAMDVLLDCSEHACGTRHVTACSHHKCRTSHLLGCIAEPKFLRRVDGLTWKTWMRAAACARKATLPLAELGQQPPAPSSSATLHAMLLPGFTVVLPRAEEGGRVERDGFAVTFPAGSIAATGEVEVGLAALDVTTPAVGALPGDSRAIDSSLRETLIAPRVALEVTLTQNGHTVSLADPDAFPPQIEVPLAPDAGLQAGASLAQWSFDGTDGLWKQPSRGLAAVSDVDGRLVAVGSVGRLGWWGVGDANDTTACLCGPVEDASGAPFAGALVTAAGLDRPGITAAQSGGDGAYCVDAGLGARVSVGASAVADGLRLDSLPVEAEMPAFAGDASTGGCGAGPTLVLPAASCVCGTTRATSEEDSPPRPRVKITTSAGSTATSDDQGRFCLAAPAERRITLFGEGYEAMDVQTGGPATAPDGCVIADLTPPS
jgi:hypothetical protein